MRIIGLGIDVVELFRIQRMLEEHGDRFAARCFSDAERDYAESAVNRRSERYAVRFAAKEAVFKALGTGWRDGISWTDAAVVHQPSGAPSLVITGRCAAIAAQLAIREWHVSLSHTDSVAVANVIATG